MVANILFLLIITCGVYAKPFFDSTKTRCNFEACAAVDPNKINVHLIAHSHDDVGWLKTVDQYFYGHRTNIQRAGVQYIIGSVVDALKENPDRKFIQVETAFFWQWWKQQPESIRKQFQEYVNNGQIEMINGAWSMNDEAAAHYHSIIDQFTWGLRILNDTLGQCGQPRIGWQIDPFGHSNEMASLFAQMGFEAVFFARLDYRDKIKRDEEKTLELIWRGSETLGASTNLFTGIFTDFYTSPDYFCWDVLCDNEPMIDDRNSPDYNIERRVSEFTEYIKTHIQHFQSNHILVPMGGDFTYQAASMYYVNIDKLIEGFKEFNPQINVIYSTPTCYLKALNDAAKSENISFPLKTDDFFPYANDPNTYWTGYFTSRPNSKRLERTGNNILQATKQVMSFEKVNNRDYTNNITLLKEAMGIMQHHDAITGTEKQHVAQDYARIVTKAIKTAEANASDIVTHLLRKNKNEDVSSLKLNFSSCLLANVSHCEASNANRFVVTVYNPLSRIVSHYVRLPVKASSFKIVGPNGASVEYDLFPSIRNFSYVHEISPSTYDLVFLAKDLPPLGLRYYYVTVETTSRTEPEKHIPDVDGEISTYKDDKLGFAINTTSGLLHSVTINGKTVEITQEFLYYQAANGTNTKPEYRASGAYIFRPSVNTTIRPVSKGPVEFTVHSGKLVTEVHQIYSDWVRQIIRHHKDENFIEFDWVVGPLEKIDDLGVEVVTRFTSKLQNNKTFYTDSNGRELIKRILNHRDTFNYTNEEPVAGNYYPVTSRIVIKDDNQNLELALLNDRAQGGSSLTDGALELMVHRHLLCDDAFGVGEALKEQEFGQGVVVRGQHYLTFESIKDSNGGINSASYQHDIAQRKLLAPWVLVSSATSNEQTLEKLQEKLNYEFSGLKKSLPENVQILTLEPWTENELLLRLENVFAKDEHSTLSKNVTVDLKDLFTLFDIQNVRETTIAANKWIEDGGRIFEWTIRNPTDESDNNNESYSETLKDVENLEVTLGPMQIRTFIISYKLINS